MNVRVITPPQPFVTPADIAGSHQPDDAGIAALIAAATEEIDGYTGWLGRCLAPQLVEWSGWLCFHQWRLPCGPVLEIKSVEIESSDGVISLIDAGSYRLRDDHLLVPAGAQWALSPVHRVQYWAGYGKRNAADASKWDEQVPARVKQAVIMSVQHLKALSAENLFLRSEDVEGVGSRTYTVSEQAGAIIRDTSKRLLSGLKVPRI